MRFSRPLKASAPIALLFALSAACGLDLTGTGATADDAGQTPTVDASSLEVWSPPVITADSSADATNDQGSPPPRDAGPDTRPPIPDATADVAPDGPPPTYPGACTELPNDGAGKDVTLYWDEDPAKPYDAHCGAAGATYVRLNDTSGKNTTSYPLGAPSCTRFVGGQTKIVTTTWTMLRFDPATHLVDTGDYTGAASVGGTHEDSGNGTIHTDYLKMPYASGRMCDNGSQSVVAKIDLTKTKLAVAAGQAWSHDGFGGMSSANADGKNKAISLSVIGYSAGVSPCAANADYYTQTGGKCLALVYSP